MAGVAVVAAAMGAGLFLLAKRLDFDTSKELQHKTLRGIAVFIVGMLLLADIVFVIEAIAHVIWPNFVDSGA